MAQAFKKAVWKTRGNGKNLSDEDSQILHLEFELDFSDQVGNANADEIDGDPLCEEKGESAEQTLQQFWSKVMDDMKNVTSEDFKTQPLPLTRIKKIMKLDEEVKMISAEAPILFAKAAEIFIHELTLRAWSHTEDNKRRTLQRNDIAMAISKSDQFDFLIDIVPRHEVKPAKPRFETMWAGKSNLQVTQPQTTIQVPQQPQQIVLQPSCTQVLQTSGASASSSNNVQQPVTLVQQVVQGGEVQNIPSQIQLTQAQLNMIRLQVQNNPSQPIIIQAQPQQSPQIIQVTSQGQHQPQQQVYLAQVSTSQDDS